MFCPQCGSEYRPDFKRCADCEVDLVATLTTESPSERREPTPAPQNVPMIDYCGFFDLEEARAARNRLREVGVRSEIAIREAPGADPSTPPTEEYWLRFPASDVKMASTLLGYDEHRDGPSSMTLACGSCGKEVAEEESFCPHCGARFEDGG